MLLGKVVECHLNRPSLKRDMNDKLITNYWRAKVEIAAALAVQIDRNDWQIEIERNFKFPPNEAVQAFRVVANQDNHLFRR